MRRRWDMLVDIGEKLKESGVVKIEVLYDRYVLYGINNEILEVITDGASKIIQAFLIMQGKNQLHKVFDVDKVLADGYEARNAEVRHTVNMIKQAIVPYIIDGELEKAFKTLDKELYNRL